MALEKAAVEAAAVRLCPPQAVLERVVLTPSGNLLACWQVAEGADPAELRRCGPPYAASQPAFHLDVQQSLCSSSAPRIRQSCPATNIMLLEK